MITLSILLFAGCFALFLAVWLSTSQRYIVVTPFLIFALFELVCNWPAFIVGQIRGIIDTGPAIMAGIAFLSYLASYTVVLGRKQRAALDLTRFRDATVERQGSDLAYLISIVAFASFTVCLGLYLYRGMPPVIAGLFQSADHSEFVELTARVRTEAKEHYAGGAYRGQGIISTVIAVSFPYLVLVSFLLFRSCRKLGWLLLTILLFATGVVFTGGGGARYQVIMFFCFFAVAASFMWRISIKHVMPMIAVVAIVTLLVMPASSQLSGVTDSDNVTRDITLNAIERITLGNGMTSVEVIDFIDNGFLDYGWGDIHLQKMINAIPGVTYGIPFSNIVQHLRTSESQASYASMTYLGILYADFGPIGVCLGYMLIGVIAAVAQGYLFRIRKGILEIPAITCAILLYSEMVLGSSISMGASLFILIVFYGLFKKSVSLVDQGGSRRRAFPFSIRYPGAKQSVRGQSG